MQQTATNENRKADSSGGYGAHVSGNYQNEFRAGLRGGDNYGAGQDMTF
jgi:hypothetical protein